MRARAVRGRSSYEAYPLPYEREAAVVLDMWRSVERELSEAETDGDSAEDLQAQVRLLRDEYQRLIREATAHHRPVPPPFPQE